MKKEAFISKIHLIISVAVVIPVAFIYGFHPQSLFNIELKTVDEHNFFKAIMGLYLAFALLWLLGIFKDYYLKLALVSNCVFMLGLGFGRLLSLFSDGTPTSLYQFGAFAELLLGFYGLWVYYWRYSASKDAN